jgi:hypothetical protein
MVPPKVIHDVLDSDKKVWRVYKDAYVALRYQKGLRKIR